MPVSNVTQPIGKGGTGALVAQGSFSLFNAGAIAVSNPSIPAIGGRSCRLVIRGSTTGTSAGQYVGASLNSTFQIQADKMTLAAATKSTLTVGANSGFGAPIGDTAAARTNIYAELNYCSSAEGSASGLYFEFRANDGTFAFEGFAWSSVAGIATQLTLSAPLGVTFAGTWELYI